ncbi:MAG: SseB family protein [Streptococcaceae bacterium]|jgi:hypothetical protein|nr:SseB family protein [Streptococcaceae bacterium]
MGLFDFFKDGDDYEGAHDSRRSSAQKAGFDASKFESNADLVTWLDKNKVILLSEDEGLIVYTNDDDKNFLQLYTSAKEAKGESINEYVEVTGGDLRDLLDEMPDISYFVLNPASNNIIIRREEMLDEYSPFTTQPIEVEHEKVVESETVSLPLDFEVNSEASAASEVNDVPDSTELPVVEEVVEEIEAPSESDEVQVEEEQSINLNEEKEDKNLMKFETASTVPQSIIAITLSLAKDGIQKFYLAQENQGDYHSLSFLAGTQQDVKIDDELIGVNFYHQDGSDEARALEDDKFLIYDKKAAEQLVDNYSESKVLQFFKKQPIVYSASIQKNENGNTEIIAFSDFSEIPELFLSAFESFELASVEKFSHFLESDEGRVDFVHLNPFTLSLYLKPEDFKPDSAVEPPAKESSSVLLIETENKKAAIKKILDILKDFDISNIALAEDKHVSFTFRKDQDAAVAKQILRMKTDLYF